MGGGFPDLKSCAKLEMEVGNHTKGELGSTNLGIVGLGIKWKGIEFWLVESCLNAGNIFSRALEPTGCKERNEGNKKKPQ